MKDYKRFSGSNAVAVYCVLCDDLLAVSVRELLDFIWSIAREVKRLEAGLKKPAVIG